MRRVVIVVLVVVIVAACDTGGGTTSTDPSTPTSSTTTGLAAPSVTTTVGSEWWQQDRRPAERLQSGVYEDTIEDLGIKPQLDMIIHSAPIIVAGTVVGVEGPFWNQASGQYWEYAEGDHAHACLYREVTLQVEEVFRGEVTAGEPLTILARGTGGGGMGCLNGKGPRFDVDDRVIVPLSYGYLLFREGVIDAYQVHGGSYGLLSTRQQGDDVRYVYRRKVMESPLMPDLMPDPIPALYPDGVTIAEFRHLVVAIAEYPIPEMGFPWRGYYTPLPSAAEYREKRGLPDEPTP